MSDTNDSSAATDSDSTSSNSPTPNNSGFDLSTVIEQAKQVITDPAGFYRGMAKSGGFSDPLIFALVMAAIAGAILAVLSIVGLTPLGSAGLSMIIFLPIGVAIGGFIAAAVMFVIWKLMGSPEDYETAYRCVAYTTAILPILAVLSIIPYLGTLVRVIWGTWLMITASTEVHDRSKQTATIMCGILAVLGIVMGLGAERGQRALQGQLENQAERMEQSMKSLEKLGLDENGQLDPEKAGRAVGAFMKGMEEAAKAAEEEAKK